MKKGILSISIFLASSQLFGQVQKLGTPFSFKEKIGIVCSSIKMNFVDNELENSNETARRAASAQKDMRFGKELSVDIDFISASTNRSLPNGDVIRQLEIYSKDAKSINLIFDQFKLSTNARLYLFDANQSEYIGAHTQLNNNINNVLGTELIHSDRMIIELVEPFAEAGSSVLHIGTVVHGFIDLESELKALNSSGSCNYDVNCPISSGWENQRNATAMMVNGGGFCTGSLINNTTGTIIPYFLSANHCGTSPASWVFRFRWESPAASADCATSAPSVNGPENMNVNGGILRANYATSDFTLTELNTEPDPAWGIYYNGWNRTDIAATSAVGIHHPAGDIKKFSIDNTPLISTTFGGGSPNSHWGITSWDNGVTEGGSSGSPLFDENHRTVGQLHGGASACGAPVLSDEYGKIFVSWTGGGSNSSRLSNWLDPSGTGPTAIDGVDPAGGGITLDAGLVSPTGMSGTICGSSVTPSFTISNPGTSVLTSATITYGYDGDYTAIYNWVGSLNQFQNTTITLPSAVLAGGVHTFQATVSNPNGSSDLNNMNNVVSASFSTITNPINIAYELKLDCYGSEISWKITDNTETLIYYQGGPYTDETMYTTIEDNYCLNAGCYKFIIEDSYGDGLTTNNPACNEGFAKITQIDNNALVVDISGANANFGPSETVPFCLTAPSGAFLSELDAQWSLVPNPATNDVHLVLPNSAEIKKIKVTNASGQIVQTMTTTDSLVYLSISQYSFGVYFVQVEMEAGISIKRLIKQ